MIVVRKASPRPYRPYLFTYPDGSSRGGIAVSLSDYRTLEQEIYLNDVVIDFYLLYLINTVLPEEFRQSIYVFSSMFLKHLINRFGNCEEEDDEILSPVLRHMRVKNWTKDVNIFEKKLIGFPICKDDHWFLILVIRPDLMTTSIISKNEHPFIVLLDSVGNGQATALESIREYMQVE